MKFDCTVLALGMVLLSAAGRAQTVPGAPAAGQAGPCIDLAAKPATTHPAKQHESAAKPAPTDAAKPHEGLIQRAGRWAGIGEQATADQNVCPLTAREKFDVWVHKSYSPVNIVAAALDAAVWQATQPRSEGGYGQGWDAYGARFGASLADTESSRFFQTFLLPVLLRQDPRYFREAHGTKRHRVWYALSRMAVTRSDDGRHTFNSSEVLGAFAAAALTNTYYPDADRNAPRTFRAAGLNLGTTVGWNLLYEFGPDILTKLKGKKKP